MMNLEATKCALKRPAESDHRAISQDATYHGTVLNRRIHIIMLHEWATPLQGIIAKVSAKDVTFGVIRLGTSSRPNRAASALQQQQSLRVELYAPGLGLRTQDVPNIFGNIGLDVR